jgi:hypothetical protein
LLERQKSLSILRLGPSGTCHTNNDFDIQEPIVMKGTEVGYVGANYQVQVFLHGQSGLVETFARSTQEAKGYPALTELRDDSFAERTGAAYNKNDVPVWTVGSGLLRAALHC